MGIPSYYSHVLKSYKPIHHWNHNIKMDVLLMDCNSIIYKCVHLLCSLGITSYFSIINQVCIEIENHIKMVSPKTVVIAFDGVAPLAKLKQQRERRFRTEMMKQFDVKDNSVSTFNTTSITPGTEFMNYLSKYTVDYFKKYGMTSKIKVIVSGSNEVGEGEHKLFRFLRNSKRTNNVCVYGLDADLIILSLHHLSYTDNIYNYREKLNKKDTVQVPVNVQNLSHKEFDFINIRQLHKSIHSELSVSKEDFQKSTRRINDYVVLSFFLGNDFLPHNPILPIRTFGVKELLRGYRELFSVHNIEYITENNQIVWKNMRLLIGLIAKREETFLKRECDHFEEKYQRKRNITIEEVPLYHNTAHQRIDMYDPGWKKRYYETLFRTKYSVDFVKNVCVSYIEGLQWCLSYYTSNKFNNRWLYPYHYPPLFSDLLQYTPQFNIKFRVDQKPIHELTQLCYVIPPPSYDLLPPSLKERLTEYNRINMIDNHVQHYSLQWDFCTYLWESKPLLPPLKIEDIEELIRFS